MLAQLLGATEAARRVGVDVEAFKAWVTGSVKPSAEEERAIRNLIEISRKAERDG
jgi:DNA-binding transcriptional regulator YdaS (Cro superfamily)